MGGAEWVACVVVLWEGAVAQMCGKLLCVCVGGGCDGELWPTIVGGAMWGRYTCGRAVAQLYRGPV